MLIALILVPLTSAFLTLLLMGEERRMIRRWILFSTSVFHLGVTISLYFIPQKPQLSGFVAIDSLGLLFLSMISVLFFFVAIYSFAYFYEKPHPDEISRVSHFYVPCMLFFLTSMTIVPVASHLGLLWVGIEATTLASAPLIYYHKNPAALEATWKYLLICSVGIALALLGIFFIASASRHSGADLFITDLVSQAKNLDSRSLRFGFILVMVGFGTKMGLAPMHTWLPDAHSQAPSPVSALLSGALLNCAFLGILRFYQIVVFSGLDHFANRLLIMFGLLSLFTACVFIARQKDYKRLLAYSSIEHMGIISMGVGIGSGFASLLHVVNHSMTKALLFLTAGRILRVYHTKNAGEVHGLLRTIPATGILFLIGGLAIIGSPPFSPFISEFTILKDGLKNGHGFSMAFYLLFLGIIFVSFSRILIGMICGNKKESLEAEKKPIWPMVVPMLLLAAGIILFGIYLPEPLVLFLKKAELLLKPL